MTYKKTFLASELYELFNEIVYSSDGEFVLYCAMKNGVFCKECKPTTDQINEARDAIMSIHELIMSSLQSTDSHDFPATAFISFIYTAMSEAYEQSNSLCVENSEHLSPVANAFLFRAYFYLMGKFIEETFYDDPIEVITVKFDKFKD